MLGGSEPTWLTSRQIFGVGTAKLIDHYLFFFYLLILPTKNEITYCWLSFTHHPALNNVF